MSDPRVDAVHHNADTFLELVGTDPGLTWRRWDDVTALLSEVPFPMFNPVGQARFSDADRARRTREVAEEMIARGLPWLWASSVGREADDEVLRELGLVREDQPGMHARLHGPVDRRSDVRIEWRKPSDLDTFFAVMGPGFGMPDFVMTELDRVLSALPADSFQHVVAFEGDTAVGCGSALVTGDVIGIYNIATPEEHRGRGIGYAVTAALMTHGYEQGCSGAVLEASAMGRSVYERLGFIEVCTNSSYIWMPPGDPDQS